MTTRREFLKSEADGIAQRGRIKPCPFCGGNPILTGYQYSYHMLCYCGASGPNKLEKQEAIAAWNERTE